MIDLIFPAFAYRTKKVEGKTAIFDILRKKFIILTPEEIVRQHLIHFLINNLNYPKSLISVEDGMKFNKMNKRSDVVVHSRTGGIFLVIECKSTKVKLTQKAMDQLSTYNQHYKASHLALTNGKDLYVCKIDYDLKKVNFLKDFPTYK